jgi:formamidopyrimidine-DNA glycosylase
MAIIPKGIQFRMVLDSKPLIEGLYKTVEGMKGIREYVSKDLYLNSRNALRKMQQEVVQRIRRELSPNAKGNKVDKATVPFSRRVNQFDTEYGVYFDYREFPGIATIVGDELITIVPKKGKYLTVPNYYDSSDVMGKHLADYPGILFNPMVKAGGGRYRKDYTPARRIKAVEGKKSKQESGSAGTPYWYVKDGRDRTILFWALKSVTVKPKVNPEDLREVISRSLSNSMSDLADKSVVRFLREYK